MNNNIIRKSSFWIDKMVDVNQYVQFIDFFTIENANEDFILNIRADSQYIVWLNGSLVGFGQYADYEHYAVFDSYPISSFLHEGTNKIAILGYHYGEDCQVYRLGTPGVCCWISSDKNVVFEFSKSTKCRICPSYESGEIERISPQLSFSFRFDALKEDNWLSKNYMLDFSWENAIEQQSYLLNPRPIKKLDIHKRHSGQIVAQGVFLDQEKSDFSGERMYNAYLSSKYWNEISECDSYSRKLTSDMNDGIIFSYSKTHSDGIYLVIDLGEEEAGYFDLDILVPKGTQVDIGFGEHLDDLRVRSFTTGFIRNFAGVFYGSGKRDQFTYYIKRLGCRYLQLHIYSLDFTLFYAGILPVRYPVKNEQALTISDKLHQKIYDVGIRTLILCMHEHYEDCPWREQALYSMDSRNQMLCGYHAFQEFDFARESIRLLGMGQRENGVLELCAPARISITIPAFSLIWIVQLQEYIQYSNDLVFGHEMLPIASKILDFFRAIKIDGLLPAVKGVEFWNFYDWASGLFGEEVGGLSDHEIRFDAPLSSFYSLALASYRELLKSLSPGTDFETISTEITSLNSIIEETFWNDEMQCFASYKTENELTHYCELTQALIICANACSDNRKEHLIDQMTGDKNELIPVTLSYKVFYYDALLKSSKPMLNHIFQDIENVWGKMIFQGATTFWETIEGSDAFDSAGSLCHGWSAIPVYYYHLYGKDYFQ